MKEKLTIKMLIEKANEFCVNETKFQNKDLFGVTDGKAVGTYIEHKFQEFLTSQFDYEVGSSAKGIDLPSSNINTDIKVTLQNIAKKILKNPPQQGYLTISNALQWRLQYGRIVNLKEEVNGIVRIVDKVNDNENI